MSKQKRNRAEALAEQPAVAPPFSVRQRALVSAVLFALVLIVFGRAGSHEFISYDDPVYVTANPNVQRGLTTDSIRWAFTSVHGGPYWQPLTWLSHEADVSLWGVAAGPALIENIILHALSVVLLFLVLVRCTAAPWRSAIAAALWGLHPLRVESVAWVAERKGVLSTFFALLTLFLYVGYAQKKSAGRYVAVFVAFVAASMAKPMVVTIPLLLLLFDWWPLRRTEKISRLVIEKLPLAAVAAAVLALTFAGQSGALTPLPLSWRLATAITNYAAYLGKLLIPVGLSLFYPLTYGIDAGAVFASIIALLAISAAAIAWRRSQPALAFGWAWYLIALVPVAGFVQAGAQKLADRFAYIPSIGIIVAVVWLIADRVPASAARAAFAAGALATLAYASMAFAYVGEWRNTETIFRHALASTGDNVMAELSLAAVLLDSGRTDEANLHYAKALQLSNNSPVALADYGHALVAEQRYEEAIVLLRRAVQEKPDLARAQESLGVALLQSGQATEGLAHLQAALRYGNGNRRAAIQAEIASAAPLTTPAAAHNDRGADLAKQGRDEAAEQEYREALRLDPKLYDAHMNLAALLSRHDRTFEAIREAEEAAKVRSAAVEPKVYLAILFAQANRRADAAASAESAARVDEQASNDYFTRALHLQPASDNLARFIADMKK